MGANLYRLAMVEIKSFYPSVERAGIEALMMAHWDEVECDARSGKPNPQWGQYEYFEDQDLLIAYAAYDNGVMIGYCMVLVAEHLHYGWLYGQHDVLYLAPEYRSSSVGLRLKGECEKRLMERKARFVIWHAKPGSTFAKILQKSKYELEEEVYIKELHHG